MYLSFNANLNSSIVSRNIHSFFGTNLNSSIICCLSSGDRYLLFGASIPSIWNSLKRNSVGDFFETLVILSAIWLPIKSPVAFAVFWIALFEAAFIASVVDFLALSRSFCHIYCLNFYLCFSQITKIHILFPIYFPYLWVQLDISFLYDGIAVSGWFI